MSRYGLAAAPGALVGMGVYLVLMLLDLPTRDAVFGALLAAVVMFAARLDHMGPPC